MDVSVDGYTNKVKSQDMSAGRNCHGAFAPLFSLGIKFVNACQVLFNTHCMFAFKRRYSFTVHQCSILIFLKTEILPDRNRSLSHLRSPAMARDHKRTWVFMCSVCYLYPILSKIRMCRQILLKTPNFKRHEITPDAGHCDTCGRTDK